VAEIYRFRDEKGLIKIVKKGGRENLLLHRGTVGGRGHVILRAE